MIKLDIVNAVVATTNISRTKARKTGIGRNPRTGEEVNIPPGKAVRFKPGKELQGIEEAKKAV